MGVGETLDIVKFVESAMGLELLEYQKDILRKTQEVANKDVIFVRGRFGTYAIPIRKEESRKNQSL